MGQEEDIEKKLALEDLAGVETLCERLKVETHNKTGVRINQSLSSLPQKKTKKQGFSME